MRHSCFSNPWALKHSMRRTGPDYSASWKAWDVTGPGSQDFLLMHYAMPPVLDDGLRLGAEGEAALTVVPSCITSK